MFSTTPTTPPTFRFVSVANFCMVKVCDCYMYCVNQPVLRERRTCTSHLTSHLHVSRVPSMTNGLTRFMVFTLLKLSMPCSMKSAPASSSSGDRRSPIVTSIN